MYRSDHFPSHSGLLDPPEPARFGRRRVWRDNTDLVGHSLISAKRCFRSKQVRSDVRVLVGLNPRSPLHTPCRKYLTRATTTRSLSEKRRPDSCRLRLHAGATQRESQLCLTSRRHCRLWARIGGCFGRVGEPSIVKRPDTAAPSHRNRGDSTTVLLTVHGDDCMNQSGLLRAKRFGIEAVLLQKSGDVYWAKNTSASFRS